MPHELDFVIKSNGFVLSILYIKVMGLKTWVLDLGSLSSMARCATELLGELNQVTSPL